MRYTLADVMEMLRRHGTPRHRSWVQWLVQTGRLDRPVKDGSGRFCFSDKRRQIVTYLRVRQEANHVRR